MLLYSILSILAVHSATIAFSDSSVSNTRPYEVSVNCEPHIPMTLQAAGGLDTATFPICVSNGMWIKNPTLGWVWGDWDTELGLTLNPGYQCALLGDPSGLDTFWVHHPHHETMATYIKCCWGPWCNLDESTRRELRPAPLGGKGKGDSTRRELRPAPLAGKGKGDETRRELRPAPLAGKGKGDETRRELRPAPLAGKGKGDSTRRELRPAPLGTDESTRRQLHTGLPNGEDFCESEQMIRNPHACQQSSCCHWNTWEHGEASFNGEGRCWSSIGTQTCHDVHTTVALAVCHDQPEWWYDSDGPYYNCHWYRQDRSRCGLYGNSYRNFGMTANEACCGCRHGAYRRALEEGEDQVPKRGFLFTNEIASGFDVESSEMIAIEGVTSTASQCQEQSWWDDASLENPTLECSAGEAIGAFYKTSLPDLETWSVEKGYCCAIEASDECTWKEVDPSAESMTCDEGYVLSGFKMDDEGFLFSDVQEIKCCRQ